MVEVARDAGAGAVIDVTVPAAHHPVTTAVLFAGLPVLGEKPAAATLAEAISLAAASDVTGQLFMVSQSRRYHPGLGGFRTRVAELGRIGSATTEFFRAPRFGGFRETMPYPLLTDMAIHHFDAARHLLDADPVTVSCSSWNPSWSWFTGDSDVSAVFEMTGGARYVYTGSWCSPGRDTSWNGTWRVNGEHGSEVWDGADPGVHEGRAGIAAALEAFTLALRTGEPPSSEIHANLLSLAMVEAAIAAAESGTRIVLADVMSAARETAIHNETHPDVRAALTG